MDRHRSSDDGLVAQRITLPGGPIALLQPAESADLPDDRGVEWAPLAPYWSVLWRSGVALARELAGARLAGKRVVELGCGLGLPSLVAARGGAEVLATDLEPEALSLLERNAVANDVTMSTATADWRDAAELIRRGPFDLVVAADILYERSSVEPLLSLLPRLAPKALIADPGREPAAAFWRRACSKWSVHTTRDGVVALHWLTSR